MSPGPAAASPARQIAAFIARFDPPIQRLLRASRTVLRRRFPTGVEMVYDNYNFLVFGYGPSERASEAIVSLAAYARGVGLAFIHGAKLADPRGLLQGKGKQTRFVRLAAASDLESPGVAALIGAAIRQAKVPLPKTGARRTVIKSISARQRPRRPAKVR